MLFRVVDIAEDGSHLCKNRGFLEVRRSGTVAGQVPLDDIAAIVVHAHGTTYTNSLLITLAERGIPLTLCGANHNPVAWLWPIESHHIQGARMRAQVEAKLPLRKRIWQAIVRSKVEQQAGVLDALRGTDSGLGELAKRVKSGDPGNIEAHAAKRYWPALFGPSFRRDRESSGPNSLLNYGYAIVRSAAARAVCAAGLHPTLGVFHSNRSNALALADDVMEPFRPWVDFTVESLAVNSQCDLSPDAKRALVRVLLLDLPTAKGRSPIAVAIQDLAISISISFERGVVDLMLPKRPLPSEVISSKP